MRNLIFIIFFNIPFLLTAQTRTGINTKTPLTTLHVKPQGTDDPLMVEGLKDGAATDKIVMADKNGVFKTSSISAMPEPWQIQGKIDKANANTDNIYQTGNVSIGKNQAGIGVALDVNGAARFGTGHNGITPANTNAFVTGVNSVAFGEFNEASGRGAVAYGVNNIVPGEVNNRAQGMSSVAFGSRNTVTGINASAFGSQHNVSGIASSAFGTKNTISGEYASAFGNNHKVTGSSAAAFGQENEASGWGSGVFGYWNISASPFEAVFGTANAITKSSVASNATVNNVLAVAAADDPVFQIGNGNGTANRSNALTLLKNGKLGLNIAGTEAAAKPTETFDIGSGGVKIRAINSAAYSSTGAADKVVVVDKDGVLRTAPLSLGEIPTATKVVTGEYSTANGQNFYVNALGYTLIPGVSQSINIPAPGKAVFINFMLGIDYLNITNKGGTNASFYQARLFVDGIQTNVFLTVQEPTTYGMTGSGKESAEQSQFNLSTVRSLDAGPHTIDVRMIRSDNNGNLAEALMNCKPLSISFNATYLN